MPRGRPPTRPKSKAKPKESTAYLVCRQELILGKTLRHERVDVTSAAWHDEVARNWADAVSDPQRFGRLELDAERERIRQVGK